MQRTDLLRRACVGAVLLIAWMSAGAYQPPALPPQPAQAGDIPVELAAAPVDPERVRSHGLAKLGDDSTFYVQAGGGSLLTGLLLGPIGVAINAHNVAKRSEREAAAAGAAGNGLGPVLQGVFAEYNTGAGSGPAAKIAPYIVYVRPKKGESVYPRLSFDVEYAGWSGRYSYHFAPMSLAEFQAGRDAAQSEALAAELVRAGQALLRVFNAEAQHRVGPVQQVRLGSWALNPLFEAGLPMGVRGEFEGRSVVVGQGTPGDHKALLSLMVGTHLMPGDGLRIDKPGEQSQQR